jgi:hypothetical protein
MRTLHEYAPHWAMQIRINGILQITLGLLGAFASIRAAEGVALCRLLNRVSAENRRGGSHAVARKDSVLPKATTVVHGNEG